MLDSQMLPDSSSQAWLPLQGSMSRLLEQMDFDQRGLRRKSMQRGRRGGGHPKPFGSLLSLRKKTASLLRDLWDFMEHVDAKGLYCIVLHRVQHLISEPFLCYSG